MKVSCIAKVTKIEGKEKKEKDDNGKLISTGEYYNKVSVRDIDSGIFLSFPCPIEEVITSDDIISLSGKFFVSNYDGKSYYSVYEPEFNIMKLS